MTRNRTEADLQNLLDEDFAWRIQEISNIKMSVQKAGQKNTMLRAGVALLYAHWEGFVKNASSLYLDFVKNQGLNYQDLRLCFVVFGLKHQLNMLSNSMQHKKNMEAIHFILNERSNKANLTYAKAINTESNLKSTVFENIAVSIGIDTAPYETKYNLIDESLLKRRNSIAHGEYLDLSQQDYQDLSDEIVALMRLFKNDIENAAARKMYLAKFAP